MQDQLFLITVEQIHYHRPVKVVFPFIFVKSDAWNRLLVHNHLVWFSHRQQEEMLNEKENSTDFFFCETSKVEKITWTASVHREKLYEDHLISGPNSFVFFFLLFHWKSAKFIMKAKFMTKKRERERLSWKINKIFRRRQKKKCKRKFMKTVFPEGEFFV